MHRVIDAALVHDAHFAINHAAKAELLGSRARGTRGGDIGHAGDAGSERVQAAQDGGVIPVGHFHLRGKGGHRGEPGNVGHIVDDTAHDGVLHMRMQIDQARHDGGRPVVEHFLFRIAQLQHIRFADVPNSAAPDENGTPDNRIGCDGQNVLRAQQHNLILTRP